ncbi:Fe-S protein assembly co-chaperone HscB [Inhella gelatinilytica]|uniref:Co-chaperone protein HscB homolog n=1 Tax=Inhella gelatinilytica TaxID=2795030 RepID=A0A931IZ75_9BURK|nr:Fe-S protein assembly co-chaperone HscB [Inhella gelatinilytica]MBH9553814.1 Fe-S protein assembly co-chaperone HscB [Inhella gelatinilytica]
MQLSSNDFELFGLPVRYQVERTDLDARWKRLAAQVHPDRHVGQGAATQAQAMQWALRVNEAYRRLRDPLARGAYLCELRGAPIQAESNTHMCMAFLGEQMEWRECLDEAEDEAGIDALQARVHRRQRGLFDTVARELDSPDGCPNQAAQAVRSLMFVARFLKDIERRRDALFPI